MIEIIVLFNITRSIGKLAGRKGLAPGRWKLYVVLSWFGCELTAGVIAYILMPETPLVYMGCAYGSAIGSYYVLKASLAKRPDADDGWLATIGVKEELLDEPPTHRM